LRQAKAIRGKEEPMTGGKYRQEYAIRRDESGKINPRQAKATRGKRQQEANRGASESKINKRQVQAKRGDEGGEQ